MAKRAILRDLSVPEPPPPSKPTMEERPRVYVAPSRIGKRQLSVYVDEHYVTQLRMHALREGTTVQACMEEAYDLYAAAHGLHRIRGS